MLNGGGKMYAICGATGNIGKAIAEKLLAHGSKVRVIGRSRERLQMKTFRFTPRNNEVNR